MIEGDLSAGTTVQSAARDRHQAMLIALGLLRSTQVDRKDLSVIDYHLSREDLEKRYR